MFCHAFIKECSADHCFGFAFRQLEPCVLELHDWSAKGFAFATICDGAFNCAFHCANGRAGDNQPLLGQLVHQLIEPFALFPAQDIFGCDLDVVKEQF